MAATANNVVTLPVKTMTFPDDARRLRNRMIGYKLIDAGFAVFISTPDINKKPRVKGWTRLDTDVPAEERAKLQAAHRKKFGAFSETRFPFIYGATKTKKNLDRMLRSMPDAIISISMGPSGLIAVDADQKENGPEKVARLFSENGGVPKGTFVNTTQRGGQHFYFINPDRLGCAQNAMFTVYGCNIRGVGGQCIAPGSMTASGKTYGEEKSVDLLIAGFKAGAIPPLPEYVKAQIGNRVEDASLNPSNDEQNKLEKRLTEVEWPDEDIFGDGDTSLYDIDTLRLVNKNFGAALDDPNGNTSDNRFNAALGLCKHYPNMEVEDFATFLSMHTDEMGVLTETGDGEGNYNERNIARDFLRAKKKVDLQKSKADHEASVLADAANAAEKGSISPALRQKFTRIEDIAEVENDAVDWTVKHVAARKTTTIMVGSWGAGKSAIALDMCFAQSNGWDWAGCKTVHGVTIYVGLENYTDISRRIRAMRRRAVAAGKDVSKSAFVQWHAPVDLFGKDGKPSLGEHELIAVAKANAEHYGLPIVQVVIDTVSKSMGGGKEDKADDAKPYMMALQRIAEATGANTMALHHPSKGSDDPRGSGAFQGDCDTVLVVTKTAKGCTLRASEVKFRIGDPNKVKFDYKLYGEVVGKDDDGDNIEVVLTTTPVPAVGPQTPAQTDPTLRADETEDRLAGILAVVADAREPVSTADIVLTYGNERIEQGLPKIGDRSIQAIVAQAVEAGGLKSVGTKKRPRYVVA